MIAKFEQAPTAEAAEELIRSLPEWIRSIRIAGAHGAFPPVDRTGGDRAVR